MFGDTPVDLFSAMRHADKAPDPSGEAPLPMMRGRTASEKLLAHSFIYSFIKKIEPLNVYWEHGVCHIMCPGPWRHNDRRNTVSAFAEYVIQSRRRTKTK